MEIQDEEFFHIHRKNHHSEVWHVGNIISTPIESFNNFYKGLLDEYHRGIIILTEYPLMEYFNSKFSELEEFNRNILALELNDNNIAEIKSFNSHLLQISETTFMALGQTRKMLRELMFENFRKNNYSCLPSRLKCFWLSNKTNIEKWWQEFKDNENKVIYKVKATGNLFQGDGALIQMDVKRFVDFDKSASLYWEGKSNEDNKLPQSELIFEGTIKIIAEYAHPSEIN